jgi:hypothetical protein
MEASDAVRCSRSRNRWRQAACPLAETPPGTGSHALDPQCPRPGKRVLARGLSPRRGGRCRPVAYARFYRGSGKPDMWAPGQFHRFRGGRVACQSPCQGQANGRPQQETQMNQDQVQGLEAAIDKP